MRSLMANLKAVFRTSTIASTGIARTARAVPSISFSGSISRRPTVTSLRQRQQLALRQDHRMRGGKVGGKRIGGARHDDESIIFVAKNRARSSS